MSDGPAKDDPTAKLLTERQSKSAFEPNERPREILRDRSRRALEYDHLDPARPLTVNDVEALLRAYFGNDPIRQDVEHETKKIYRYIDELFRAARTDDLRLKDAQRQFDGFARRLESLVEIVRTNDYPRVASLEKRLEALVASVGAHYGQYDSHRAIYGAQFDEFASTLRKADDRFLGLAERTETALESMKTVLKPFTPQYERAAPHAEPQGEAALRIEDAWPVGAGTDPPGNAISDVVLKAYERLVTADQMNPQETTKVSTVELRAIVGELVRFRKHYGTWPVR
jgi:hypothetical protein